jgi:hypothetical protein
VDRCHDALPASPNSRSAAPAFGDFLDREVRSFAELVDAPDLARDAQGADRCHGEQAHAQLVVLSL